MIDELESLSKLGTQDKSSGHVMSFLQVKERKPWSPCLTMREGETVYDLSWFPGMTSSDPETCCFAATAKDHPVHLYDAFDGQIRASYR